MFNISIKLYNVFRVFYVHECFAACVYVYLAYGACFLDLEIAFQCVFNLCHLSLGFRCTWKVLLGTSGHTGYCLFTLARPFCPSSLTAGCRMYN